jgi:UDP-N-acetylmuramate: L-alanyl-gamma-D-glutamyl-meso-diaminopimelate ligase
MRIHILGICGTFMGGVAALAQEAGHQVSGSDQNVYPPMSTQLRKLGIRLQSGWDDVNFEDEPDCVLVGNVMSRGNPAVERLLDSGIPYFSGAEWLAAHLLKDRWVLAVAGTHGKTTTSSMLAWILDFAGLEPGFLIGGVPTNFGVSARSGGSEYFVVEADEYDTAFFDKRAKFVHYRPRTLVINNIEYDHADIYPDIDAILWQFHQLLRTVPGRGLVTAKAEDAHIATLLERGLWTPTESFARGSGPEATWTAQYDLIGAKSRFSLFHHGERVGATDWDLLGNHNLENALAAISAAAHVGVEPETALEALSQFQGVKRRLEKRGVFGGATLYEDFAHHPTAIATTLEAVRARHGEKRIVAVLEPRSNTMRLGVHRDALPKSLRDADLVYVLASEELEWSPNAVLISLGEKLVVETDVEVLVEKLSTELAADDQVVMMSNGNFQGLPRLLQQALKSSDADDENGAN